MRWTKLAWVMGVVVLTACGGAPAHTTSPSPSPSPSPATSPSTLADAEIPNPCSDGTVQLSGGTGQYDNTIGLDEPGEIELQPLGSADLDGDGTDEQLAYVRCMPGGSGTFDSVRAYHLEQSRFVEVAAIEGGDRADGGLDTPRVVNRDVLVGRYSGDEDGVCCPTHVTEETWQLANGRFVRTHVGATRAVEP